MPAWNQSRIKLWRQCQRAYAFRYDTQPGREMVPYHPPIPLKRGGWLHELQEAWHREWAGVEGASWKERHTKLEEAFNGLFEEERAIYGDLPGECLRLFKYYLRFCRESGDEDRYQPSTLIGGDQPSVEFVISVPLDRYGISWPFKGRIDLLVEDREYGGLWIWDSKWVRSLPGPDERMMAVQALMYVWALREKGYDVRGFVFNYGRTKPPTIPRVLKSGMLSQAKRMDTDFFTYANEIRKVHGDQWKHYAKYHYDDTLRRLRDRSHTWFRRDRIPTEPDRVERAVIEFVASIEDIESRNTRTPPRTYTYTCERSCVYHGPCVAEFNGLAIKPLIRNHFVFEEERYGEEVL